MSYLNAASHGLPDSHVYVAMAEFLETQARQSPAKSAHSEAEKLLDAKKAVASILSADVDQLGFASTTTAAWHAVTGALDLAGKRVLVTEHEWGDFYVYSQNEQTLKFKFYPRWTFLILIFHLGCDL